MEKLYKDTQVESQPKSVVIKKQLKSKLKILVKIHNKDV